MLCAPAVQVRCFSRHIYIYHTAMATRPVVITVLYRETGSGCDEVPAMRKRGSVSPGDAAYNAFRFTLVSEVMLLYRYLTWCLLLLVVFVSNLECTRCCIPPLFHNICVLLCAVPRTYTSKHQCAPVTGTHSGSNSTCLARLIDGPLHHVVR